MTPGVVRAGSSIRRMEARFHCYHTAYGNVEVTKVTVDRLAQAPPDVALQRELPVAGPLGTLAFLALAAAVCVHPAHAPGRGRVGRTGGTAVGAGLGDRWLHRPGDRRSPRSEVSKSRMHPVRRSGGFAIVRRRDEYFFWGVMTGGPPDADTVDAAPPPGTPTLTADKRHREGSGAANRTEPAHSVAWPGRRMGHPAPSP